jgi:hypothetical protein
MGNVWKTAQKRHSSSTLMLTHRRAATGHWAGQSVSANYDRRNTVGRGKIDVIQEEVVEGKYLQ